MEERKIANRKTKTLEESYFFEFVHWGTDLIFGWKVGNGMENCANQLVFDNELFNATNTSRAPDVGPIATIWRPNTMWRRDGKRRATPQENVVGSDACGWCDATSISIFDSLYLWEIITPPTPLLVRMVKNKVSTWLAQYITVLARKPEENLSEKKIEKYSDTKNISAEKRI